MQNDFIETGSKYFLNETLKIFTQLTKILNDSKSGKSTVNSLPPSSFDPGTIEENTFLRVKHCSWEHKIFFKNERHYL